MRRTSPAAQLTVCCNPSRRSRAGNQVLELKGNIRVLCRVRPLLEKERGAGGDSQPVRPGLRSGQAWGRQLRQQPSCPMS